MLRLVIPLIVVLVSVDARQRTLSVQKVTDRMQRRYETMRDATATFTQHVKFGFSNVERMFTGSLTMKKPRKYRIESEYQTLVTDGSTVWAYSPVNRQVLIDRYKENEFTLTPDQFFQNLPARYTTTLVGMERLDGVRTHVLRLVPKDERAFITSMRVWVEDGAWTIRKVVAVDINQTETTYTISSVKFNSGVSDFVFSFQPPDGVDVVDLR